MLVGFVNVFGFMDCCLGIVGGGCRKVGGLVGVVFLVLILKVGLFLRRFRLEGLIVVLKLLMSGVFFFVIFGVGVLIIWYIL